MPKQIVNEAFDYNELNETEWAEIREQRVNPKEVAKRIVRLLKPNRPDYHYGVLGT